MQAIYNQENPITIDFWGAFGVVINAHLMEIIDEFEDKYPWINVNYESKGGYTNLQDNINTALDSNSYPNVVLGYPDNFAEYITYGIQYALDPFIEHNQYGIDLNDFYQDYLNENQTLVYKDKNNTQPYIMGLPFCKSTEVMVYNYSFFNYYDLEIPSTWEEVVTVSKQILEIMSNNYGKIIRENGNVIFDFTTINQNNFHPISYDSLPNLFTTGIKQWGGEYIEMGDSIEKGYIKFNNPQTLEFLTFFNDMYDKNYFATPVDYNEAYCSNAFKNLSTVMLICSSAGIANNIPLGNKFEIDIAPIPYKDEENKAVISQGTNLAMLKGTPYENTAAWLLIKYLTAEEGNVDFALRTGYLPVTKSGVNDSIYQSYLLMSQLYYFDSIYNYSARLVCALLSYYEYAISWNRYVDPAFKGSGNIREYASIVIKLIFYGDGSDYTPQQAIDYCYTKLSNYQE